METQTLTAGELNRVLFGADRDFVQRLRVAVGRVSAGGRCGRIILEEARAMLGH